MKFYFKWFSFLTIIDVLIFVGMIFFAMTDEPVGNIWKGMYFFLSKILSFPLCLLDSRFPFFLEESVFPWWWVIPLVLLNNFILIFISTHLLRIFRNKRDSRSNRVMIE